MGHSLLDYQRRIKAEEAASLARCLDGPKLLPCRGATATEARARASERRVRRLLCDEPGGLDFLGMLYARLGIGEPPARRDCPLCHGSRVCSVAAAYYDGHDEEVYAAWGPSEWDPAQWQSRLMGCPRCGGTGEVDD